MENGISSQQILPLILLGAGIMLAFALTFVFYFNITRKRLWKAYREKQDLKIKHQNEILQRNLLIQEEERQRIARDLHDEIGSKLSVLSLYLYQLGKPEIKEHKIKLLLNEASSILSKTSENVRLFAHKLLPPTLEKFGVISAVKELCEEINASGQLQANVNSTNDQFISNSDYTAEINIFRIIQELCTNSLKHGASTININIEYYGQKNFLIEYFDNGPGYNPRDKELTNGLGLHNIKSRLSIIGASIINDSKPNKGVFYTIFRKDKND